MTHLYSSLCLQTIAFKIIVYKSTKPVLKFHNDIMSKEGNMHYKWLAQYNPIFAQQNYHWVWLTNFSHSLKKNKLEKIVVDLFFYCIQYLLAADSQLLSTFVLRFYCCQPTLFLLLLPPQSWWSVKWWIMDSSSSHSLFTCFWHCQLGAVTWSIKDDSCVLISQSQINDWSLAITKQNTSDGYTGSA